MQVDEHEYVGMGHCLDCALKLVVQLTEQRDSLQSELQSARTENERQGSVIFNLEATLGDDALIGINHVAHLEQQNATLREAVELAEVWFDAQSIAGGIPPTQVVVTKLRAALKSGGKVGN